MPGVDIYRTFQPEAADHNIEGMALSYSVLRIATRL